MARQESIIKLIGTLGELTFYKTPEGYYARQKRGHSAERIKTDPAFERTRENMAEFGRAAKGAKIIRAAFRKEIMILSDSRLTGRLTSVLMKVIKADSINVRGQRNVIDGETELLVGFEFNGNAKLGQSFHAPFTPSVDRVTGTFTVDIPSFVPEIMVRRPEGATHFQLTAIGAEFDFEAEHYLVQSVSSALIAHGPEPQAAIALTSTISGSTKPLFLAFGIQFFQQVNGQTYPLKNGGYNALSFVLVDGGV